jgi:ankyrin repeat protein
VARRHLTLACYKGDVAAISDLLQQGAGVDQQDYDGYTPLFVASSRGHVDAARLLLDKGAEVHRAEENGRTPLYIVCWNGHVDAARLLLDKGAEVDRATEHLFKTIQAHVAAKLPPTLGQFRTRSNPTLAQP